MKFRLFSDLHIEFTGSRHFPRHVIYPPPVIPDEKDMTVLLAGDIFLAKILRNPELSPDSFPAFVTFMRALCDRHKYVLWVPGNHEHYHGDFADTFDIMKEFAINNFTNLHPLNNSVFRVSDDVVVVGATMWTDFDGANPVTMFTAARGMSDFHVIKNSFGPPTLYGNGPSRFHPEDALQAHLGHKEYVFNKVKEYKEAGDKVVVMTHHAPSALSIDDEYADSPLNGAYYTDFTEQFLNGEGPDAWVHGHVHCSKDYTVGGVRVLCNPHGYGDENSENARDEGEAFFNDSFTFEV